MRASVAAALCALAVAPPAAATVGETCGASPSSARGRLDSPTVATKLKRGEAVDLEGKILAGDLVLRPGSTISAPFRCRNCRILGDVVANDVDFERNVDLSGTTIAGDTWLERARFERLALFDSLLDSLPKATTVFHGRAAFTQARFVEGASFRGAVFRAPARFASARMLGDASFADACFDADADFRAAVFAGEASFQASTFDVVIRRAAFREARFAEGANFRGRRFLDEADFERTTFGGTADLSRTEFEHGALFDEARLVGAASFLAATFYEEASFDDALANESVDFTAARFLADASFFDFTSSGALLIDGSRLSRELVVSDDTTVRDARIVDLRGVLAALRRYGDSDNIESFLAQIESAAKDRDDLALANQARYERRKLTAEGYGRVRWLADFVFYRGVAGYLVRPLHPLATLLLLAFVFAVAHRYRVERLRAWGRGRKFPPRLRFARAPAAEMLALAGDTVQRVRLVGKSPGEAATGRGTTAKTAWLTDVERWIYRVLVVIAALALANSNPTLRQMFDALI